MNISSKHVCIQVYIIYIIEYCIALSSHNYIIQYSIIQLYTHELYLEGAKGTLGKGPVQKIGVRYVSLCFNPRCFHIIYSSPAARRGPRPGSRAAYVCTYVYLSLSLYIYIYICMYMYIYIYI